MSDRSPILSMPYIQPSQAQKHVTHNEALRVLDGVVQLSVLTRQFADPPATAEPGARFVVAAGGTGAWEGRDQEIAVSELGGGWHFLTPRTGWLAWVEDETQLLVQRGPLQGWQPVVAGGGDTLGLNATADATNRLTVAADATLLTHDGGGHQVKINKAGAGDTASLLYQTGFSGRAEMGLAGTDDFAIKVSADGATWADALRAEAAGGTVVLPQGARVEGVLTGSAVLGTVAETGGIPSGALLERGSTAEGDYVRYADGTQICTSPALTSGAVDVTQGALFRSGDLTWTYPRAFAAAPQVAGSAGDTGRWPAIGTAGATDVTLRVLGAVSGAADSDVRLTAVGRWF